MGLPAKKIEKRFTYKDYRSWPEDERWELIDGVAYNMSAAPSRFHQGISGNFYNQIKNFLKDKTCKVYTAPFDVRLPESNESEDDITTVVEPDIIVICDPKKLDDKGCKGAPDWIIEIISPNTASKDQKEKFNLYEKHQVKEYWIVDPVNKIVHVYSLGKDKKYGKPQIYDSKEKINSGIFTKLKINLKAVFKDL